MAGDTRAAQEELFRRHALPVMRAVFTGYEVVEARETGPRAVAVRKPLKDGMWVAWIVTWSQGVNAMELACAVSTERALPAADFADFERHPDASGYRSADIPGIKYGERFIPFESVSPKIAVALKAGLARLFTPLKKQADVMLEALRGREKLR